MKKRERPPYKIVIEWSEEDQVFIARVPELEGVATHGDTEEHALEMAHEAIDLHLQVLQDYNEDIPQAVSKQKVSGKYPLRMEPELHRNLIIEAKKSGKSLNEHIVSKLKAEENDAKYWKKIAEAALKMHKNNTRDDVTTFRSAAGATLQKRGTKKVASKR